MPDAGTHSSRRINTLIKQLEYKRYLEIGVRKGATFLAVSAEHKTAIDPKFTFDFETYTNTCTRFFQVTSDEYFSRSKAEMFDVFFLDGLHTFEQTFRDFCSSLACGHPRSVWLIDDTVPNDVYSALPVESAARRFRREAGGLSESWHGDVFKVVFAIHDFFPALSYCTINTGGNPQTLVWRQPRADFTAKFNSLETISRLSYFDFKGSLGIMKLCDEATGLKKVVDAIRSVG